MENYQLAGPYVKRLSDGGHIHLETDTPARRDYFLWRDGREETEVPEQKDESGEVIKEGYTLPALEPHEPLPESSEQYKTNRRSKYPDIYMYIDAQVKKSDPVLNADGLIQEAEYFALCLDVKRKDPKPEVIE